MNKDTFEIVRQSVADYAMTEDERQLERLRITRDKKLPKVNFLFRIFGKPCFPRGELVAVTGKAKSGKTLFISVLMACCVRNEVLQVQREGEVVDGTWTYPPLRCLWYDTEQSEQSTQDILCNRILKIANQPQAADCYDIFNVRCVSYDERLRLFKTALHKYHPDLVVLDGVRDLIADINDGVKAQEIVECLMQLAQETNCCLICVLHQNKGAEDRNLRGWIGTEMMNKAFEVYACEKVKPENIFVVEQTHTRKYDLEGLMFFRMDTATELPVACDAPTRYVVNSTVSPHPAGPQSFMNREYLTFDENNKPHPKTDELFYDALKAGPLFYTDLQMKVMNLLNCGTPMWNKMFREMRDRGTIVRTRDNGGKTVWKLAQRHTLGNEEDDLEPDLFDQIASSLGVSPSS